MHDRKTKDVLPPSLWPLLFDRRAPVHDDYTSACVSSHHTSISICSHNWNNDKDSLRNERSDDVGVRPSNWRQTDIVDRPWCDHVCFSWTRVSVAHRDRINCNLHWSTVEEPTLDLRCLRISLSTWFERDIYPVIPRSWPCRVRVVSWRVSTKKKKRKTWMNLGRDRTYLNIPFPTGSIGTCWTVIRLVSGMMTSHVLDQFTSPSATVIAPTALEVSFLFLELPCLWRRLSMSKRRLIAIGSGCSDHRRYGLHPLLLLLHGRWCSGWWWTRWSRWFRSLGKGGCLFE